MRVATKFVVAGTAVGCTLCVVAPLATAADQAAYFGGTRQNDQPSTTSPNEHLSFYKPVPPGVSVVTIQYPRDLAPLVGTKTLDQSVAEGVAAAHTALGPGLDSASTVYLVGVSQGALVAQKVKVDLAGDDRKVVLLTYGDPTNTDGGLLGKLPIGIPGFLSAYRANDEVGQQNTTVAIEYDIVADAPDLPNPVSWVNALMGAQYYHHTYNKDMYVDDDDTVVTRVTTGDQVNEHYLVKTPKLPLVQPLRDMGVDENFVKAVEKPLKRIVDSGYIGNRTTDSDVTNPMLTGNKATPGATASSNTVSRKSPLREARANLKSLADNARSALRQLAKPKKQATPDGEGTSADAPSD